MKNINTILITCILVIVVGLLVLNKFITTNTTKKIEKKKEEQINYIDFTSYDKKFTFRTSKDWELVDVKRSLNKDADLELYNDKLNAYFLLVVNSKKDYKNNYLTYKKEVFKQKQDQYKMKIKEYKRTYINNFEWLYTEFNYINENKINTFIRSYAIETKEYYGQIMMWTVASNKDLASTEFDNVINGFREN